MGSENFDAVLKQAMDIMYDKMGSAASNARQWEDRRKECTGLRGLINRFVDDDYAVKKAEMDRSEITTENFIGQMVGASNAIADFLRDNLPSGLANTVISAAQRAAEKYADDNKSRILACSIPASTMVRELGGSIESAMYLAAQNYFLRG
jgi:hypothetical protein